MTARKNLLVVFFALGLGLLFVGFNNCSDTRRASGPVDLNADGLETDLGMDFEPRRGSGG